MECEQTMSEQEAWLMVNKISGLIEERDALKQRVEFLVAEAHGWQPRLEAAEAREKRLREALTEARDWINEDEVAEPWPPMMERIDAALGEDALTPRSIQTVERDPVGDSG